MAWLTGAIAAFVRSYEAREELDLLGIEDDPEHVLLRVLLFALLPLWTGAGVFDWWCHRETDIEHTAGVNESLLHLLMFTEAGTPLMLALFCEVDAVVILALFAGFGVHELTAFWDVGYAATRRDIRPREQHTHSFLEVLPLTTAVIAGAVRFDQVRAIFSSDRRRDAGLRWKERKMPRPALLAVVAMLVGGIALPYGDELLRCLRARGSAR